MSQDKSSATRALTAQLVAEIQARGPLSFERFMDAALYAPGIGYYARGANFEQNDDFITAPELGGIFGQCVRRWTEHAHRVLQPTSWVEIGAGSGALAEALLRSPLCPELALIERSPRLRETQAKALGMEPCFLSSAADLHAAIVVGNEVLDAIAPRVLVRRAHGWCERTVTRENGRFVFCEVAARNEDCKRIEAIEADVGELPIGFSCELQDFASYLRAWLGIDTPMIVLFIDYGYSRREKYLAERRMGTLVAHRGHRASFDVLADPGLSDLSLFVDFTTLADALSALGFRIDSFGTQAQFLLANGLEEIAASFPELSEVERSKNSAQLQQLMLPGEMGEKFRVLIASRGVGPWDPRAGRNLLDRL